MSSARKINKCIAVWLANREVDQRHKRECNHFFYGREGGRKEEFKKKETSSWFGRKITPRRRGWGGWICIISWKNCMCRDVQWCIRVNCKNLKMIKAEGSHQQVGWSRKWRSLHPTEGKSWLSLHLERSLLQQTWITCREYLDVGRP